MLTLSPNRSILSPSRTKGLPIGATKEHACKNCVFRSRTCGSSGPKDSPFVIVGESPGKKEITYGMPFVGESGDLLRTALLSIGYSPEDIEPYVTNAIKCFPGNSKDQSSLAAACRACSTNLIEEIQAYPRTVILALGNAAVWSLTGNPKLKITQCRGTVFPSPLATEGIVASVHPAFLLRGSGSMSKFRRDMQATTDLVRGTEAVKYIDSEEIVLNTVEDFMAVMGDLQHAISRNKKQGLGPVYLSTDLETSGFSALEDRVLCLGFGWENNINYIVPERAFKNSEYLMAVRDLMEWDFDELRYIWHNGKFDIQFLWALNIKARVDEDTMLLSYALDENKGLHDLEQVSNDAVGAPNWKAMLDAHKPSKNCSYALLPRGILHKYAGKDIAATLQTFWVLSRRVEKDIHLRKAYREVMIYAVNLLALIESTGFYVDKQQVSANRVRLQKQLQALQKEFEEYTMELCGQVFNINSPIHMATLLYDILKLPPPGKPGTDKARTTGKPALESMPKHKCIDYILAYRKLSKALGTYVKNLLPRWEKNKVIRGHAKRDGRVHSTFLIHGTVTGRLSCRDPNLQNIPRDAELRAQFSAMHDALTREFGYVLIEVDLNQAELRCLAELSKDPDLMAIYLNPKHPGLHHEVSVSLFGEHYTGEDKMRSKAVNFGIVYGRTGASIAAEFDIPNAEGEKWISGWALRFPVAWEYIQKCREAPLKGHSLITPFGRKRRFGVVNIENFHSVQNEASNFPFQSIASDITLVSNGRAIEDTNYRGKPVNIVHDAGIHEVVNLPDVIDRQVALLSYYMEREARLWGMQDVPHKPEAKIGTHWGKLQSYQSKIKYDGHQFLHL